MLAPKVEWTWVMQDDDLYLQLDKGCRFKCHYRRKHLLNLPDKQQGFSLSDTEFFTEVSREVSALGSFLGEEAINAVLINATAAMQFHKPIGAKSWFFDETQDCGAFHRLSSVENTLNSGMMLIIEDHGVMSSCMLLSESFALSDSKTIGQFDIVKIANNRLRPCVPEQRCQLSA